jgi:hypothetical protein
MNLNENIRRIKQMMGVINESVDDYLDAILDGGYIYWDEKDKLFIGKNLDRVRNLDSFQKRLVSEFPDIILFIDGDNTLIPYYIDGNEITGGSYKQIGKDELIYREWKTENAYIEYGPDIEDDFDGIVAEFGSQLEEDGRPYIDNEETYDEIDEMRMEKIMRSLTNKSSYDVSQWVKKYISDERYWDSKKSISDVSEYIIKHDLWDKVKDDLQ